MWIVSITKKRAVTDKETCISYKEYSIIFKAIYTLGSPSTGNWCTVWPFYRPLHKPAKVEILPKWLLINRRVPTYFAIKTFP